MRGTFDTMFRAMFDYHGFDRIARLEFAGEHRRGEQFVLANIFSERLMESQNIGARGQRAGFVEADDGGRAERLDTCNSCEENPFAAQAESADP